MFKFLQRWFLNGTPETSTALLNLWVPTRIWQRFTYDFRRGFPGWSKRRLQIFRYKKQLCCLFWKSKSACRKWGMSKVVSSLLRALTRRQCGLLQANCISVWGDKFERNEFYVVHRICREGKVFWNGGWLINVLLCDGFFDCTSVLTKSVAEMTFRLAYILNVAFVALYLITEIHRDITSFFAQPI